MQQRRRSRQTSSLDQRLAQESQNLRKQAEGMPAGIPRDDLLRKARQAETLAAVQQAEVVGHLVDELMEQPLGIHGTFHRVEPQVSAARSPRLPWLELPDDGP